MDEFQSVKQDSSDVLFSLHDFDPPVSPVHDVSSSTHVGLNGAQIIQQVLASPRIKNAVSEIAQKQGKTVDVVFDEVKKILDAIGHSSTLKSIRFMAYILRKVFRNIYTGIKVNMDGLKKVKELSKECPVVLVPSHRSYTDFLLVSFVCYIFQLPLPVIAAAQDFQNMTLVGGLLRSCGAFYMKRSFRSDELYWAVFFEYVQCLVLKGGTTMEFFLEGTRSRSGKSLHPKQGLLSILTDLYFTSRVPDVMFCPISISYERVLEETLLARELLGIPKPKESLKGLLNARSVLSDDYGFAYLYFGKPISLREFSEGKLNRQGRACIPRSIRSDPSDDEMVVVRKLASHILEKIQDHLIILPNMVVASILLQNPRGINLGLLIDKYGILLGWCETCSISVVGKDGQDCRSAVMESLQLLKSSLVVTEDNNVCLVDPAEHFSEEFKSNVYGLVMGKHLYEGTASEKSKCAENSSCTKNCVGGRQVQNYPSKESRDDRLAECELSMLRTVDKEYVIHLTCVHLQLAHQRNQLLHWFYVPAMVVLTRKSNNHVSQEQLYSDSKFLGDLVCVEVAKDTFPTKENFFSQLEMFKEVGISVHSNGLCDIKSTEALCFMAGLWRPLIISYWVVYTYIIESCTEGTEYVPNTLIHSCQEFALSLFLKGIVNYLEIQSLELLKNGLKSLQKLHIISHVKYGSEKNIVLLNKVALYNLTVTLEGFLQLSYSHPVSVTSQL